MKNTPQNIWLNLGAADELDTNDFRDLDNVTWSDCKVNSGDVKYVRDRLVKQRQKKQDEEQLSFLKEICDKLRDSINDVDLLISAYNQVSKKYTELQRKLQK